MPDFFKLVAKTLLVISMIAYLASALMSGNINPLNWSGAPFPATILAALSVVAGGLIIVILAVYILAAIELRKAAKKRERWQMRLAARRFEGPPIGDWQQRYYDPRQY